MMPKPHQARHSLTTPPLPSTPQPASVGMVTRHDRDLLMASPSTWDECCFAVPALRALASSGMGAGVLCRPDQRSFWQSVSGIEVLSAGIEGDWKAALLWEDGPLAKAIIKARIERRIGPKIGKLAKCLTHPLQQAPHPTEHRVQFYLSAVEEMGIATAKPEFFAPAMNAGIPGDPSLLLAPDSDFGPSHEWLPDRWHDAAQEWLKDGRRLTIACPTTGRGLGRQLAARLGDQVRTLTIDLRNAPLDEVAPFSLLIAADGSLPHLAAHAGVRCLTLFGPNNPGWRRPIGKRHRVLHQHVECAPCRLAKCPLDLRCQNQLELQMLLNAARELMEATP